MPHPEKITDAFPYGFLMVDGENRVTGWNYWLETHTGLSRGNTLGRPLGELYQLAAKTVRYLEMARSQNRPMIMSAKLHGFLIPISYNGTHISGYDRMQQECHIVPLCGGSGDLCITIRDVTSLLVGEQRTKALKTELKQAIHEAESANRAKSDFLGMISHDIRTPMNAVLGFSELLLDSAIEGEHREYLSTIQSSARMLVTLLDDLLDFSCIEAGKLEIRRRPFLIEDTVREVIRLFQSEAAEKQIELITELGDGTAAVVTGDPVRFQQILINLISNGIKFTDKGSVTLAIETQMVEDGARVRLDVRVRDTGDGIPKEMLDQLFKPFTRLEDLFTKQTKGTGLGLVITKRLCQAMGGDITVTSTYGTGSEFRFHLFMQPVGFKDATAYSLEKDEEQNALSIDPELEVLVADDSATNLKLAKAIMSQLGVHIVTVSDGFEALVAVMKNRFDGIFMDIRMPGMSGHEVTRKIRSGETGPGNENIFICAMTALAMESDRAHCLEIGMNDYISKPFNTNEIKRVLRQISREKHPS